MNQDELIEKIGCLLTGWTLDKKHAEELLTIIKPILIIAGVKAK